MMCHAIKTEDNSQKFFKIQKHEIKKRSLILLIKIKMKKQNLNCIFLKIVHQKNLIDQFQS